MRQVWAAMAIVLLGLLALLALEDDAAPERPAARSATVSTIASRVEVLRGLKFRTQPVPQRVSPAQARHEGLEDLDRSYPETRRRADEEVLKLLGLIEPDVDLRNVSASVFGEGVAGYYDPRSKRLRIVSGTTPDALSEMVLAHELTHALEDQRFGLAVSEGAERRRRARPARARRGNGDARHAGVPACATSGRRRRSAGCSGPRCRPVRTCPSSSRTSSSGPTSAVPQFIQAAAPDRGGKWTLVDLADRVRGPDSTEQVMHPDKWLAVEKPLPVRLDVKLHDDWHNVASGTWGEWQTRALLGGADEPAAGWGGDRYELWQRARCAVPPCRDTDLLVMRWRWDSVRDAREFETALRARRLDGATVEAHGDTVTLVLAPTPALARRVLKTAG